MSLLQFALTVIIISISGVMTPGPLFASNISYGIREGWKAGFKVAYGHTLVELPLVILIGFGAVSLGMFPPLKEIISVTGAIALFGFAGYQLRGVFRGDVINTAPSHGPFLVGVLMSAFNPFFLLWWLTVGFKLILDAIALYSLIGVALVFGFHIWMDYAWLATVAFLSGRGKTMFTYKKYKVFMIVVSGFLVYFGASFLGEIGR